MTENLEQKELLRAIQLLSADELGNLQFGDYEIIDWSAFFRTAYEQSIFSLLYQAVKDHLPQKVRKKYGLQYAMGKAQRKLVVIEAARVVEIIEQAEIPVCVSKGFIFSHLIYGNETVRQFTDVDLYVRERDMKKICGLLVENGYHFRDFDASSPEQYKMIDFDAFCSNLMEMQFFPPGNSNICIEVKSHDDYFFKEMVEKFINRRIRYQIDEYSFPTFCLSDSFVCLIANAYKNCSREFGLLNEICYRDFLDIHMFIKRYPEMDYREAQLQTHEFFTETDMERLFRWERLFFDNEAIRRVAEIFEVKFPFIESEAKRYLLGRKKRFLSYYWELIQKKREPEVVLKIGKNRLSDLEDRYVRQVTPMIDVSIPKFRFALEEGQLMVQVLELKVVCPMRVEIGFLAMHKEEMEESAIESIFKFVILEIGKDKIITCKSQISNSAAEYYPEEKTVNICITKNESELFYGRNVKRSYLYIKIYGTDPAFLWCSATWENALIGLEWREKDLCS